MAKTQISSPKWGTNMKLVIALTIIFLIGALVARFHTILGPALMAIVLAYLLHPLVSFLHRKARFSWGLAVNLIYLVFILILLALITWGGVGLIGQVQNLITAVQNYANDLPGLIESLSHRVFLFGPFKLDLSTFDWQAIGQQVLSYVQPALGKLGGLVGALASGAASTLGWTAFVVIVSYFFLLESGGLREGIIHFDIPGYTEDIRRITQRLGRIWNAFLRGQIIIFFSKVIAYTVVMSILGVHYSIGVALVAGFAGFLPYVGPAINWAVIILITYFQGGNIFGLTPLVYTLVTLGVALLIDQVFDNLVAPRLMSQALKVHPAFVLIAAIVAANLLGILGVVVAAPLLATLQLLGRYTMRKLLDRDPWPASEEALTPLPMSKFTRRLRHWLNRRKIGTAETEKSAPPEEK
jgi:predicted PurR-regulated permease PerM